MKLVANDVFQAQFRQLFRALLRESTYLPDPTSRVYFRSHVVARFRAYNPKDATRVDTGALTSSQAGDAVQDNDKLAVTDDRLIKLKHECRKMLHKLNKANCGYQMDLRKVLLLAYGRIGRRCYELLEPLKALDATTNLDNPALRLKNRRNVPSAVIDALPGPSTKLQALLISQLNHSPPEEVKPRLRRLGPDIAEKNIWSQPMPVKRVVNAVKGWYGNLLSKALPPPAPHEWEYLKNMATGQRTWPGPVPRRSYCGTVSQVQLYRRQLKVQTPEETLQEWQDPRRIGGADRPHKLDPRFMRRMYQEVFRICPSMVWNEERRKWKVTWGSSLLNKLASNAKTNSSLVQIAAADVDMVAKVKNV